MSSLWFVVPCYRRFDLTRMTLRHLADLRELLDYDVHAIIVAEDENQHTADELGFISVPARDIRVGAKFNQGYRFALAAGADYLVHWQSDNTVIPDYFEELPGPLEIVSGHYCTIQDGERRANLYVEDEYNPYGAGPFFFAAELLRPLDGRPISDALHNGVDGDLVRNLLAANEGSRVVYRDLDPEQFVSHKDSLSINSYDELIHLAK